MEDNEKPIYLDQEGYEKYLKEIDNLKERIHANDTMRSSAFNAGASDGWSSSDLSEVERVDALLSNQLRSMIAGLKRIVIVEKINDNDLIDVGDIILVEMEGIGEESFKLVGSVGDPFATPHEVSINSPLGAAIYHKRIGETCKYSVAKNTYSLVIKDKLSLTEEEDNKKSL
jgi:transcription elongation factor GreA